MKALTFIVIILILTNIVSANSSGKVTVSVFVKEKSSIELSPLNQESKMDKIEKRILPYLFDNLRLISVF